MGDSTITHSPSGISFNGRDAVELYRAVVLNSALGLLKAGVTPTRGLTKRRALAMVTRYTGQEYKRTEIERAQADLLVWIETMKSALPIERSGS
jgi:hypothetical protein